MMSELKKVVASRHKIFKDWVYGAGGAERVGKLTGVDPSAIHKYLREELEVPKIFMCLIREGEKYAEVRAKLKARK